MAKRKISSMSMAKRIELRAVEDLIPYDRNSRTHSDEQVDQIVASIKQFGFNNPVLIDKKKGIIAGHGRLMAARKLKLKQIPVVVLDHLTDAQRRAYIIADNKLAENAGWDDEILSSELAALIDDGLDLSVLGFSDDELADLLPDDHNSRAAVDEDKAPEVREKTISKIGNVWELGNHRLMCGDSTSVAAVEKLMAGQPIDMVYNDPPYGIAHSGKGITANGVEGNDFGEIMGDQNISVAVDTFNLSITKWPSATLIFWGANYYCSALPSGYGWIVWDKQREGNTFSGAELAFVNKGVRLDVFRHMWHGMVKASEHGQSRVHPTQKPIALAEWCFDNYGKPNNVVDLFGGSGSTLIACEKTNRKCFMMELDPHFCDVIIKRWENYTGRKASRL